MKTTTFTQKYQVHIPADVRREFIIIKLGKVSVRAEDGKVIIEPIAEEDTFVSLGGKFAVKKPIKAEKIRNHIEYSEKK